jgi:hypothetical protein
MNPILGYLISSVVAWAFYIAWMSLALLRSPGSKTDLAFNMSFAAIFSVIDGFVPTLGLLILPWVLAVRVYRRVQLPGWIFFPAVGAASVFLIGCAASSLAPKPLFVEDQTFLQGAVIAAERQGVCMALAGLLFGLTYWFLSGAAKFATRT